MPLPLRTLGSGLALPFNCPICGFFIVGQEDAVRLFNHLEKKRSIHSHAAPEWLAELRAFHHTYPFLSGVGLNSEPSNFPGGRAPLDPSKRYDDEAEYDRQEVAFAVRSCCSDRDAPRLSNGGYPIHDSCWQLLDTVGRFWYGIDIMDASYSKFFYRLHHSTLDGTGEAWAGDYGGLWRTSSEVEHYFFPNYGPVYTDNDDKSVLYDATFDPFDINALSSFVEQARSGQLSLMPIHPIFGTLRSHRNSKSYGQFFGLLPTEVLYMITEYLSTPDLLNFWIASPAVPDYFPQGFWRSRFRYEMELGHVIEIMNLWSLPNMHWYTVFWKIKDILSSPSLPNNVSKLRNRRRILTVASRLLCLAKTYAGQKVKGKTQTPVKPVLLETDGFTMDQLLIDLPPPTKITALHVSTVLIGDRQYVCGLRINDATNELGYWDNTQCESFIVDKSRHGRPWQMGCYMDHTGVRGVYILTDSDCKIGNSFDAEVLERLSHGALPLGKRLIGHFDATKFVALGVDEPATHLQGDRDKLLWLGGSPPPDTRLDIKQHFYREILISRHEPWGIRYNPVQHHIFKDQSTLVEVVGYLGGIPHNLLGIDFVYRPENNSALATVVSFGYRKEIAMPFAINGPGGERITEIRVTTVAWSPFGPILSLCTNRGRASWFCIQNSLPTKVLGDRVQERCYVPGSNEYIAGLMWASGGRGDQTSPIWNFGILCRPRPEKYPEQ